LGRNSQNSSKPPSSDAPGASAPKRKRSKGRKRGGQPGHRGHFARVPERVDEIRAYRPSRCKHCERSLVGSARTEEPVHHYVYELPEIRPIVTDHQRVAVCCSDCGHTTWGDLPSSVPRGGYGPSVQAMTALIRGELRQSVRQTSAMLTHVLHIPMSTGMVCKVQEQVSRALAGPYREALEHTQRSLRVSMDETGWREDKKRAWLWVSVTAWATVFLVHAKRSSCAAKALLGEGFAGILTTDRWSAYTWIAASCRQLCWSHLKRDFASFLDYGPDSKSLGERLLHERRTLFRLWHRFRREELTRSQLQHESGPVRKRILALLEEGAVMLTRRKVGGMCRQMLKLEAALFTFIDVEGVEPTNNISERAIRFAVLMRKGSFGSDSVRGSRFIERFLTARATLRTQRRNLYVFLQEACRADLQGTPPPSLLADPALVDTRTAAAA